MCAPPAGFWWTSTTVAPLSLHTCSTQPDAVILFEVLQFSVVDRPPKHCTSKTSFSPRLHLETVLFRAYPRTPIHTVLLNVMSTFSTPYGVCNCILYWLINATIWHHKKQDGFPCKKHIFFPCLVNYGMRIRDLYLTMNSCKAAFSQSF